MSLLEVCSEYLVSGKQGQLVIKFVNDVHLCKILIANGEAVHIAHGRVAPEAILETLPLKAVEWVNFIAGYPVRKRLDLPLHAMLMHTAKAQQHSKAAARKQPHSQAARPVANAPSPVTMISTEQVTAVLDGFIERIGPLGSILAEKIARSLDSQPDQPMPQPVFERYIIALAEEVPQAARASFIAQFILPRAE